MKKIFSLLGLSSAILVGVNFLWLNLEFSKAKELVLSNKFYVVNNFTNEIKVCEILDDVVYEDEVSLTSGEDFIGQPNKVNCEAFSFSNLTFSDEVYYPDGFENAGFAVFPATPNRELIVKVGLMGKCISIPSANDCE